MTELFISLKNDGKLNVFAMFTTHFLSSVLGGSFPRVPMSTFQRDRSDEGRKSVPRVKNKKNIYCIFVQQMLHYPYTADYKENDGDERRARRGGGRAILYSFGVYNCLALGDGITL